MITDLLSSLPLPVQVLIIAAGALAIMNILLLVVMLFVYIERKVAGHIQSRLGPMEVGPHGTFQLIADAFKLLTKQDVLPEHSDKLIFRMAPVLIILPAFISLSLIPFSESLQFADFDAALLLIFALTSFVSMALLMAGWSSNNKYSLLGGIRSAAQVLSYEIVLILSTLSIVILAGSLSLREIVAAQSPLWYVVKQPLAFLVFFVASVAELNRTPFDIPEAESELVAGYFTEYSGMRFALFFLAEYANMFLAACIITVLFLGGWHGPFLPGIVWFCLKVLLVVLVFIWMRWSFPRFRVDQLMSFGWKVLIPLSLLNVLFTGMAVVLIG